MDAEYVLWCENCNWSGDRSELVAATDDLEDRDFSHCPDCGGTDFEEDDQGEAY